MNKPLSQSQIDLLVALDNSPQKAIWESWRHYDKRHAFRVDSFALKIHGYIDATYSLTPKGKEYIKKLNERKVGFVG